MKVFKSIKYIIDNTLIYVSSFYGSPVNKVADQKAREILEDPTVFWYMAPNRLGTPAWHYGNLLTAKLKDGSEANFLLVGDSPVEEHCSFYFSDEPNSRLRLHWKTQIKLNKVALDIKDRQVEYFNRKTRDKKEELAQLTEERISQI